MGALSSVIACAGIAVFLLLGSTDIAIGQADSGSDIRISHRMAHRMPVDQEAVALLRRKLRPTAEYRGQQVSEVRGRVSEQQVEGNTRGVVRVDYLSPPALKGNILIYGAGNYGNYHRATNTLDAASWPTNELEQRIIRAIGQRRIAVQRTGQEKIAGRDAGIVELSGPRAFTAKFWIDLETGIQLKNEMSNARGIISRTYITSIVVGPPAAVRGADFSPWQFRNAAASPVIPSTAPRFLTVKDAAGELPFTPIEPAVLPTGYHLTGVWIFASRPERLKGRGKVLLRYTDNLANFTLCEHISPQQTSRPGRGAVGERDFQFWKITVPAGELNVNYIGHLSPDEIRAVHDSLR